MSTVPPQSHIDRRRALSTPSPSKQSIFLASGITAAVLLSISVPCVGTEPVWLLALIPSIWVVGIVLLVVSAWRMKTSVLGAARTILGPVEYLAAVSATAGIVLSIQGTERTARLAGGGSLIVALLLLILAAAGYVHRLRNRRAAVSLRAQGIQTRGVVTSTGLQDFPNTPNPKVAKLTVEFTDHEGTRRWLTPTAFQVPNNPIKINDEVTIWFDPNHPGDLTRIVTEFDNGTSRIVRTQ